MSSTSAVSICDQSPKSNLVRGVRVSGKVFTKSIIETIQNSEIVLRKERIIDFDDENLKGVSKISIPYKYVWVAGVLCLFTGIGFLLLGSKLPQSR